VIGQRCELANLRYATLERETVESINWQKDQKPYLGLDLPTGFEKNSALLSFGSFEMGWIG